MKKQKLQAIAFLAYDKRCKRRIYKTPDQPQKCMKTLKLREKRFETPP